MPNREQLIDGLTEFIQSEAKETLKTFEYELREQEIVESVAQATAELIDSSLGFNISDADFQQLLASLENPIKEAIDWSELEEMVTEAEESYNDSLELRRSFERICR